MIKKIFKKVFSFLIEDQNKSISLLKDSIESLQTQIGILQNQNEIHKHLKNDYEDLQIQIETSEYDINELKRFIQNFEKNIKKYSNN